MKWALCVASLEPRVLPGVQPWEESMRWPKPVVDLAHCVLFGSWEIFVLLETHVRSTYANKGKETYFLGPARPIVSVAGGIMGLRVGDKDFRPRSSERNLPRIQYR